MDEFRTEKPQTNTHTTNNRTDPKPAGGGGMWLLVGGFVVLVAIGGYFALGDRGTTTTGASQPAGGNTAVDGDAPASQSSPVDSAPVPVAPAPAPQSD